MAVPRDTWSEVLNNGPELDKSVLSISMYSTSNLVYKPFILWQKN